MVQDILTHFDARLKAIDGKAMIVCMSRRICAEVYDRIVSAAARLARRHGRHRRSESRDHRLGHRPAVAPAAHPLEGAAGGAPNRFKDPASPLKLVIVRDMWLTGFDAPCLHTLYVDKPMKGHGLMQAIARVNRVFRDKPSGLVVDYIGIAAELKSALAHYSQSDQAQTGIDEGEAVGAFLDALDVARTQLHGFEFAGALGGSATQRLSVLPGAIDHILQKDLGPETPNSAVKRFSDAVATLVRAYKLASGSPQATEHTEEVAFFAAVAAGLVKLDIGGAKSRTGTSDFAIQQLINNAVASTEVVDILEFLWLRSARHQCVVGRLPVRAATHAAQEPRRRSSEKAPERRNRGPHSHQRRAERAIFIAPRAGNRQVSQP